MGKSCCLLRGVGCWAGLKRGRGVFGHESANLCMFAAKTVSACVGFVNQVMLYAS